MQELLSQIKIKVNDQVYLKDPESSKLGRVIVSNSIELIDEIGFEAFTFKKLGTKIGSPESTIYRYFENKHKLLVYLISWYWGWLEYRLVFSITNVTDSRVKLTKAIELVTETVVEDSNFSHINEATLNRIVISESMKAYFTKAVDEENKEGFFLVYKRLVRRIADIVLEISPDFEFPNTLISTVIEGSHQQKYFGEHLPSLSDCGKNPLEITRFFQNMVFSMIDKP